MGLEPTHALDRCELFSGLTAGQRELIVEILLVREVPPGTLLASEGAYGDTISVLVAGAAESTVVCRCELTGRERAVVIARLEAPGEAQHPARYPFFGEMCLIDPGPGAETVESLVQTTVWEINRDDLYWLFGRDAELQRRLLINLAEALSVGLASLDREPGAALAPAQEPS
jgi:CRP-like cAMP-binding protein